MCIKRFAIGENVNWQITQLKHIAQSVWQQFCSLYAPSLLLAPSPLSYVFHLLSSQRLFTEIENLGLMFKASVQLSGRLLDCSGSVDVFCLHPPPSPTLPLSVSSLIYPLLPLSVASFFEFWWLSGIQLIIVVRCYSRRLQFFDILPAL